MSIVAPVRGRRAMGFEFAFAVPLLQGFGFAPNELPKLLWAICTFHGYILTHWSTYLSAVGFSFRIRKGLQQAARAKFIKPVCASFYHMRSSSQWQYLHNIQQYCNSPPLLSVFLS